MVKSDEPETMGMEHLRKLFIGGLDGRTTEETLKSYFEQWGTIVDVVVMKDPKTKRSRGFGFITYSEASMVDAAQAARPHKIDAKVVEPKRAVPRSQITSPETSATVKKIFVGGIKDEVTEADMEEYFGKFGNIISVSLATEKDTGKKRGFGFIEFDDYDAVDRICRGSHSLKNKPVDVKKAFSKAELAKIHGGRNGPNESNQNTNNGPDWNAQGGSGAMHNNWNGPPMNMAPGGYGPRPNWGNNNWSNPPGCMPGNMGQGMNAGPGCMYPTGMTPNNMGNMGPNNMGNMGNMGPGNMCGMPMGNMGPPNMGGMQNYGNMPPGMGMNMGMGMPDAMQGGMCAPGMPNANMTGGAMNPAMANNMANGNRMGNNMPMMNAAPPNWNYGQCGNNSGWGNSNEHLAAPYQQNDTGGPVRAGPMSGTPARNAPYNQNANSGSSGYGNNHGNSQAGGRRF